MACGPLVARRLIISGPLVQNKNLIIMTASSFEKKTYRIDGIASHIVFKRLKHNDYSVAYTGLQLGQCKQEVFSLPTLKVIIKLKQRS